ncbi:serine/threonine-protein kinase [Shewanella aegiceratis]|uniref:serine/threonine-protein kinase n=1 Tax=Shewanella aegiceratis TaxID=2864203 RepID=UPI001C660D9F|nr:serine/threonine-protein kinase [Shewanella aegiceratis]QYJ83412.1 serine/threonine protein kinase [Shewanella aegiceratis]
MDEYSNHLKRQGFELIGDIGSGLSGKTKKAKQGSLERFVAVKFFDSVFNQHNSELKKKFKREAFILAEAQHPAIPYVITHGEVKCGEDSVPYIVMEYIDGTNLEEYIQKHGVIEQRQVITIATQILDALSLVHSKGIIHRDIKPSNIMLSSAGHAYLIDFSIGFAPSGNPNFTRATRTGDHLGSVEYISPEQNIDMKNVDCRTDIYSLGLTLCKLLTGEPTLKALDKPELSIPHALRNLINKASEYDAENRYQNVGDILRELKSLSGAGHFAINTPSKALCSNLKCPDASWSPNGYYKGANFIENSIDIHCTSCGEKLTYQCACGYPIAETRFCGGCGAELFRVPECDSCGSYLKKQDIGKDISSGCSKCLSKKQVQPPVWGQPQQISKDVDFDDDIPF